MRVVVTDSNVLINLMHVLRLGLLGRIPGHEFVVPDHVHEEIRDEGQRQRLDSAIADGWLRKESITSIDALAVFADLIQHIGRGEAACIAIAAKEGWCVASDEKRRFRREAETRIGKDRILGTVEVFVLAIGAGLLTVEEADADKVILEGRRFKVPFTSYRDLAR
ncbi:hypothetical protein ACFL5O_11095 [Myxococcota bacterium]